MKIFYDGDCYFCRNFVQLLQLREVVGEVRLISLREDNPDAMRLLSSGLNVNSGFVVEHEGRIYHGGQAFQYLNELVEPATVFNRVLRWLGGVGWLSSFLYPVLVLGRYVVLAVQGGALIDRSRTYANGFDGAEPIGPRAIRFAVLLLAIIGMIRLAMYSGRPPAVPFAISVGLFTASAIAAWAALFSHPPYARTLYDRLRFADAKTLVYYAIVWLAVVNAFDLIAIRRIVGFVVLYPWIFVAFALYRQHSSAPNAGRMAAAVPLALLLFASFPGLYLAPFYGGIAGWTLSVDKRDPIRFGGYKLVNDRGEEIWYNHAFFQPITMNNRLEAAFRKKKLGKEAFMKFMFANYSRIYPVLTQGRMPHEWLLGRLAYPTHNLSDSNAADYIGRFAPNRITELKAVTAYLSWEGELLRAETRATYSPSQVAIPNQP